MTTLTRIGQLALEEGVLTGRDVFDVLRAQRETPSMRFGEIAVEMGLMRQEDLRRLIMLQSDRRQPFERILVDHGVLTAEQMASAKADYLSTLGHRRMGCAVRSKIAPWRSRKRAFRTEYTSAV